MKTDYENQVISIDQYGELYRTLMEIDPVYAVLAQVMMQTYLPIEDVCKMPLHSNRYNRYLPLWPEFDRQDRDTLRYKLLNTRGKLIEIDVYGHTLQAIYEDYIQPYYQDRKELFDSYLKREKASSESWRTYPENILWLTKSGEPVKPSMLEDAFRDTGLKVVPNMLRHTGATHTLWHYCVQNKVEPDERLATMFQYFVNKQLTDLETTSHYIRTIQKIGMGRSTDQMTRFFEYRGKDDTATKTSE